MDMIRMRENIVPGSTLTGWSAKVADSFLTVNPRRTVSGTSQSLAATVHRIVLIPLGEKWFPDPGCSCTDFRSVTYAPVFDGRKSNDPRRWVSLLATIDSIV